MLVVGVDPRRLEALLGRGRLACPACGGRLSPWGYAKPRTVRVGDGERVLRARRALCRSCACSHVLMPAWAQPRRRDGTEVIGEALRLAAGGAGHRRIAVRVSRPAGTVRGWLRSARRHAQALRHAGARWYVALDVQAGPVRPAGSALGEVVELLALAARAGRLRFGRTLGGWELASCLTGGLLAARPALPP